MADDTYPMIIIERQLVVMLIGLYIREQEDLPIAIQLQLQSSNLVTICTD